MKRTIKLLDKEVEYTLLQSTRARRMRLAMYAGGDFVVTIPRGLNERFAEGFIRQKARWVLDRLTHFKALPVRLLRSALQKRYLAHRAEALRFATERVEYFSKLYGFSYNAVTVRNQRTRWGSCSRKGNLNFNFRILFLPPLLADYLVVHELCHLQEFNHSRKFWGLVAQTVPNFRVLRRELKSYDLRLG